MERRRTSCRLPRGRPCTSFPPRERITRRFSKLQSLLQQDGINLIYSNKYGGSGLSQVQKNNFAPRFGFAYQVTPKLVVRGGYGIYFGAFENRGGYPSLGYSYPFQYSFHYPAPKLGGARDFPEWFNSHTGKWSFQRSARPHASECFGTHSPRNPPALQDGLRSELQPDVAISAHCQRFPGCRLRGIAQPQSRDFRWN